MPRAEIGQSDGPSRSQVPASAPSFFKGAGRRKLLYIDKETCGPFFATGYPEENVYRLALLLRDNNLVDSLADLHIAFISSHHKETYMWSQCSHLPEHQHSGQTISDYHCILLQTTSSASAVELSPLSHKLGVKHPDTITYVWDMESSLAFPTRLMSYAEHALRVRHVASSMDARHQRVYRVVPAEQYLRYFASDRKHHPRRIDGAWSKSPPPELPCIVTEQGWKNSMHRYLDFTASTLRERAAAVAGTAEELSEAEKLQLEDELRYGQILDEQQFLAKFVSTWTD